MIHEFKEEEFPAGKSGTIDRYLKQTIAIAQSKTKKFYKISHHVERRK